MRNPWGRERLSPRLAVLLALSVDPRSVASIAAQAGLGEDETREALARLTEESLAIPADDGFELTGPLSWFGDFAAAVKHGVRKNFVVTAHGEPDSHLYLCEIRLKGGKPVGDPLNETASVFACGKTAQDVAQATDGPTCADCRSARRSRDDDIQ